MDLGTIEFSATRCDLAAVGPINSAKTLVDLS